MQKPAVIFDLDGTAVDTPDTKLPSPRLIQAVQKLQDKFHVCAATGRSLSWAMDVVGPLALKDLCITAGGTNIIDPQTQQVVWRQAMSEATTKQVLPIMEATDGRVLFDDYTEDDYWQGFPFEAIRGIKEAYFLELVFLPHGVADAAMEKLLKIEGITALSFKSQKQDGTHDIHIIHESATKEHGVAELLQRLGVDSVKSIGIGDGRNDIHLFNAVAHKVAVGNAIQQLKDKADEIIGPVQEDGLAVYFEQLASGAVTPI